MTELNGSGAITEQYLKEAEGLKPILEARVKAARERERKREELLAIKAGMK